MRQGPCRDFTGAFLFYTIYNRKEVSIMERFLKKVIFGIGYLYGYLFKKKA